MRSIFAALSLLFLLTACEKKETLRIGATSRPHAEMLSFIKRDLEEMGIDVKIIQKDDYDSLNKALIEGEIHANFFQHLPFLESQINTYNYPIASLAHIHIEPMGIYSNIHSNLNDLNEGAAIAIPTDPSNQARALMLLHKHFLIHLDDPENRSATLLNISNNPMNFKFFEVDAEHLASALPEVDLAVIPTNVALQSDLSPEEDSLATEDHSSPYVNVIAVRMNDIKNKQLQALSQVMTSEKMRSYILGKYKGSIIPGFTCNK